MINQPPSPADETAPAQPFGAVPMASAVQQSAQQIWLAGMGAFAKAQEEGGRVFEALVREGLELQRKTQAAAEERIVEASSKLGDMHGRVASQAGQQWDRLESIFEERVSKSLNRLGMPSVKDVRHLMSRVDQLAAQVAEMAERLPVGAGAIPAGGASSVEASAAPVSDESAAAFGAAEDVGGSPVADTGPSAAGAAAAVKAAPSRRGRQRSS